MKPTTKTPSDEGTVTEIPVLNVLGKVYLDGKFPDSDFPTGEIENAITLRNDRRFFGMLSLGMLLGSLISFGIFLYLFNWTSNPAVFFGPFSIFLFFMSFVFFHTMRTKTHSLIGGVMWGKETKRMANSWLPVRKNLTSFSYKSVLEKGIWHPFLANLVHKIEAKRSDAGKTLHEWSGFEGECKRLMLEHMDETTKKIEARNSELKSFGAKPNNDLAKFYERIVNQFPQSILGKKD